MKNRIFFVLTAAAAFFAACNADNSGAEEAAIIDSSPGPRYGISIVPEKEGAEGMIAITNADGVVTVSPAGNVKAGATVTLSVNPGLISDADDSGGGGDKPEYWFVKSISGSYSMEGGPERTNVSFRPSADASNKWTFRMTPGDLTITVDFTQDYPDDTNAALGALYVSSGAIIPDFAKDNYDYTIAVPFGTAEFSISAQAENPYLGPVMQPSGGGGDSLLDTDLMAAENGGPLDEGSHRYGINITSADGNTALTYRINVVMLPDLSLETFKVTRGTAGSDDYFVRDLAPADTQNVYVPYTDITVVAEANGDGALVTPSSPVSVSGLLIDSAKTAIVTVSKTLPNVEASLTAKNYTLNLYYGEGMAVSPIADGGYVSFMPGEAGFYYEIHTFKTAGAYSLAFDPLTPSVTADCLIVAGGGGAGGGSWGTGGGGGGAGGLLYKTGETLTLARGSVSVTVGNGGTGGTSHKSGADGGKSAVGAIEVPGGGGGGLSDDGYGPGAGRSGGSGGGGGAGYDRSFGGGGATTATGGVLGHAGGKGSATNASGFGGGGSGGGGAGSAGNGATATANGSGGAPWTPDASSAWVTGAAGVSWFSRGGNGGGKGYGNGPAGTCYGDGGSGGGKQGTTGGNGCRGIVIIRFRRALESKPESPE